MEVATTITADNRGETISIQAGKTLAIELRTPAGYSWELTWDSGGFVEPREALRRSGGGAGRSVGGETTTYFLNSSFPGFHSISLVQSDPVGAAADQFAITVDVTPAQ